jgi:uncharacterized repeat protein (TIGR02543 family)
MKKILFLVGTLFLSLALIACEDNEKTYTYEEVLETIEIGYSGNDNIDYVSGDLTLPLLSSFDKNAKLSWESSNEEIITATGEVTRPLYDTEVTLILSLRVGSISRQELYTVTVKGTIQFFTVTFNIEGVETTQTIEENQLVSEPTEEPAKDNHVFTGWYLSDSLYNFNTPVTSNITLTAGFDLIQSAQYVIEFYEQRIENDTYQRQSNEVLVGTPGETIELNRSKTGFQINSELSVLSGVVTTETPLILKIYFDRALYDVTFMKDSDTVIEQSSVKYNDVVTLVDAPIVDMYEFAGWFTDPEFTQAFIESTLVTEDLTLYAKYEEVTEGDYQVVIYEENLNDNLYTLKSETTYTVDFGTFVTFGETKEGFTLNESISTLEGTLEFGEELTLEVYYDRVRYDVQFIDETVVYETTVKYNGVVSPIDDLVKEGYEFIGWTRTQNGTNEYIFETLVTSDVILYALWKDLSLPMYEGYYVSLNGVADSNIESQLRTIITTGFKGISYGDSRYILDETDKDPNNPNNIILIYLGTSISGTWDNGDTWNREHVWPQSLLGVDVENSTIDPGSDLHNLKPANPAENTSRSNKYFSNVTTAQSYAPRQAVKGDVARILFYMATRYSYLSLIDVSGTEEPGTYQMAQLSVLLQWHIEDPVDDFERNRNEVIFSYQKNRNPFIDHPELVERIWGPITLSNGDSVSLDFYSEEFFVDITVDTYVLPSTKKNTFLFA